MNKFQAYKSLSFYKLALAIFLSCMGTLPVSAGLKDFVSYFDPSADLETVISEVRTNVITQENGIVTPWNPIFPIKKKVTIFIHRTYQNIISVAAF